LIATRIVLGSAAFQTDRGPVDLPAWLVSFKGVEHPATVLAVAPSARFGSPSNSGFLAHGSPEQQQLVLDIAGAAAGSGPCTADYTAQVTESSTAVVVRLIATPHPAPGGEACDAVGYPRQVAFHLDQPLAARVLVEEATQAAIALQP
jgi:hypothetical protein